MALMDHIRNALRSKSPQEKMMNTARSNHSGKHISFDGNDDRVHVLTNKKPMAISFEASRRHKPDEQGRPRWKLKTYHSNGDTQDWRDPDHWIGHSYGNKRPQRKDRDGRSDDDMHESVTQMPGTNRWEVGDTVEHQGQRHTIYSMPTMSDGRHPKSMAVIHPEGNKRDLTNYKRVYLRDLKKV